MSFLRSQGPALVALFVALTGTAYAAGLRPNVVGAKQLRANAVTQPKLALNAVDGSKVADNSITGADVREGSLAVVASAEHADTVAQAGSAASASTVPSVPKATDATHALDAPFLARLSSATYQRRVTGTCAKGMTALGSTSVSCGAGFGGFGTVLSSGAIIIQGSPGDLLNIVVTCHNSGKVSVGIKNITPVDGTLNWFYSDGTAVNASGTVIPASGTIQEFDFAGKRIEGQFIGAANGKVNTLKIHALDFGSACEYQVVMLGAE
jgi:hypothetical protein